MAVFGCASAFQYAQAASSETFGTEQVSRRAGGQVIYYQLDNSVSTDVQLSFTAKSGEVHIGNFKALTENDEQIPTRNVQIIREPQKDARGRYILRPGEAALKLAVSGGDSQVSVISFRAEAFVDNSEITMKSTPADSDDQPSPNPNPNPGSGNQERQCQEQVTDLNAKTLACSRDSQNVAYEKLRTENNVANLEATLDRQQRPVKECTDMVMIRNQNIDKANAQLQGLNQELGGLRSRMDGYRQMLNESRVAEFECYVRGRHEGFRGRGRTRAEAIANTVNQCGVNNCGKRNWDVNYDCRPVR